MTTFYIESLFEKGNIDGLYSEQDAIRRVIKDLPSDSRFDKNEERELKYLLEDIKTKIEKLTENNS